MAKHETVSYTCDRCSKKLKTCNNEMNIVTDISNKLSQYWSRLHVEIVHRHGMHNDGNTDQAELCKSCAIAILQDALNRVKKGERTSAGWHHPDQETWE